MLAVLDPSRRTGGDHRKHAAVLHSVDKFMRLFHDREVGAEICVKYLVKAQPAQSRYPLTLHIGSDRIAEMCIRDRAAAIDGCNVYQAFFKIILRVIKPAVLTRGVFIFISIWNEFAIAQVLGNTEKLRPIPVALQSFFLSVGVSHWGLIGAAVVMTSLPSVLIYCLGNKQIENALTAGAVLK